MKEIWGVSEGSYSDYSVLCLCSSEELANKLVDRLRSIRPHGDAGTEKFIILEEEDDLGPRRVFSVRVDQDGKETWKEERLRWPWEKSEEYYGAENFTIAHSERGYEVALKAARDKMYELKAKKHGL